MSSRVHFLKPLVLIAILLISLTDATQAASNASIRAWYFRNMSEEERVYLQINLVFAGGYQGIIDGDIGGRSIQAIKVFQRTSGFPATGKLTENQNSLLKSVAGKSFGSLGLQSQFDNRTGFSLYLPSALLDTSKRTRLGTSYSSFANDIEVETIRISRPKRTMRQLYQTLLSRRGRVVTYSVFKGNWFIVSGLENSKRFYSRFHSNGYDQRGFSIAYEDYLKDRVDPAVILMSNIFRPYSNRSNTSSGLGPTDGRSQVSRKPNAQPAYREKPKKKSKGPSSGSGFFVSTEGHLVTNAHVIEGCSKVSVDGWGAAKAVEVDTKNDLAVLKVTPNTNTLQPLKVKPAGAKLGEDILVLGYPLRGLLSESSSDMSITTGVVSSLAGLEGDKRYLTISAPVQPGNSGGPLVNRKGEVLGVVSAKLNALRVMLLTGDVPQNVNFAIKSQILMGQMLIAGVDQPKDLNQGKSEQNDTAELVAKLKNSVVVVKCN